LNSNPITYSLAEEQFLANIYSPSRLDYKKLFYRLKAGSTKAQSMEYESNFSTQADNQNLTLEEAEKTYLEIQYSAVLGSLSDVSLIERRKFSNWIMFNLSTFQLFESMYCLSRDVDYACY